MAIKFEKQNLRNGYFLYYKKGFTVGKKELIKEGWKEEPNPTYLSKGRDLIHYNTVMKVWVIETSL